MSLFVIIPAYNEEQNIEQCVNDWYPIVEKHNSLGASRLIIVNDGSTDQTFTKLQALAEARPLLIPVSKENGGHGSAVLYGYRYAIDAGAEWIFQTDSDGQTNPAEFDQFWENRNEYDAVIGIRTARGDGKDRKFVENTVCFLLRIIFGVRIADANAPFRLMKTDLVKKYIGKLPENYNLPNIMFTTYFVYFKEKILFLPVSFTPRKAGKSSVSLKKIIKIGWKAIGDFYRLKRNICS
jgi:glycosyltransferase involved in cell wall biosynthesis